MGRPSILPELRTKLEARLARAVSEWLAQPETSRAPTLPLVNDKVNVRALAAEAGFTGSQEQHLFKLPELRSLVDAVALEQGIETIGSRVSGEDDAVERRLRRAQADRSELSRMLAEREALVERLRAENAILRERLAFVERTGLVVRGGDVL